MRVLDIIARMLMPAACETLVKTARIISRWPPTQPWPTVEDFRYGIIEHRLY